MKTKKSDAAMLAGYDRFVARMNELFAEARASLVAGHYDEAYATLARMSQSHARTSMSLRNVLVRNGLVEEDK